MSEPNFSADSHSKQARLPAPRPDTAAQRLDAARRETTQRFQEIVHRESVYAAGVQEDRRLSGWFGALHRGITLSDPYEIEISRSGQLISSAKYGASLVEESKKQKDLKLAADQLNSARRLAGLAELNLRTLAERTGRLRSHGLSRVDTDQSHFVLEQEAITVSRDVGIAAAVAIGSFAGGALTGLFTKTTTSAATATLGAQVVQDATMSAGVAFVASSGRAVDDVNRGARTLGEAAADIGKTTLWAAVTGGVFGAITHGCQNIFLRLRPAVTQQRPPGGVLPKPKCAVNETPDLGVEKPAKPVPAR